MMVNTFSCVLGCPRAHSLLYRAEQDYDQLRNLQQRISLKASMASEANYTLRPKGRKCVLSKKQDKIIKRMCILLTL